MHLLINFLKQQARGIVILAVPLVIIGLAYPALFATAVGRLFGAMFIGLYVAYLNWRAAKNHIAALQYSPSGIFKDSYEEMIKACDCDPATITLRYAYSQEGTMLTAFSTISIDPLICLGAEQDPQAATVKAILLEHTVPHLSEAHKIRLQKAAALCSPAVQRFIFKHELGHVVANYTDKKLLLMGFCALAAAYTGITVAIALKSLGALGVILGVVVGGLVDILCHYASNLFFKTVAERNADLFAARFSSREDIAAAADYFDLQGALVKQHPEDQFFSRLPAELVSGHPRGATRAKYLRKLLVEK